VTRQVALGVKYAIDDCLVGGDGDDDDDDDMQISSSRSQDTADVVEDKLRRFRLLQHRKQLFGYL